MRSKCVKIGDGSFAAVIRQYQLSPTWDDLEPATRKGYAAVLRLAELHEGLGGLSVEEMRPSLVQAFLDGLSDRPGLQKKARTALQAVQRWALVRDYLPYPITTGTTCIESDGGHEPWSDEQVDIAISHARPDLARVVTLAVYTGQRGSDVVKMRWSDLEERDEYPGINVIQKKTKKRLWIPLRADLIAAMKGWERRPPFYLVLNPRGEPYTRDHLTWAWWRELRHNPALEPLKGLVLHGLRATAVVRARKEGASALEIASTFGMSEPMVARYSRLAEQEQMAVAVIRRLDKAAQELKRERK